MRGNWKGRTIDRLENLAIVLLSCLALFLLCWLWNMQSMSGLLGDGPEETASFAGGRPGDAGEYQPAALMVQTDHGRYGVQYDQEAVNALYNNGLDSFLASALDAAEAPEEIPESRWRGAVASDGLWLWYDYLYDIPCPGWELPDGTGVRGFLLTGEGETAKELLLYSDSGRRYYACALNREAGVAFPALPAADNGAAFAFETEALADRGLSPVGMLLSESRDLPAYQVSAPLAGLDAGGRRDLLLTLGFNPSAVSVYQTADGIAIREGADNLRLEKDGTLIFHGGLGGENRYQASSESVSDLISRSAELMARVLPAGDGRGRMVCREVLRAEEGVTELRFSYLLGGVEVRLPGGTPAARFEFRGSSLTGFTVRARLYTPTEGRLPVLPVRQAAAMLEDLDGAGGELRLCYQETGDNALTAGWVLRAGPETE